MNDTIDVTDANVSIPFTPEQLAFLVQMMNNEQLAVSVKHARVASDVYALVMRAAELAR